MKRKIRNLAKPFKAVSIFKFFGNNVNKWIRTPGNFYAYIDFDKILREPADPEKILKNYTEDWLHPNIEGYVLLGKSVDLSFISIMEN